MHFIGERGRRAHACERADDALRADLRAIDHAVGQNFRVVTDPCVANDAVGPDADAVADEVHIGNFVEVKNSKIASGSKANHLTYVGDADVGRKVNLGAGTIVANYDGANKHRTVIEDNVHTGSNSVLVAPITVGAGATVGAGSTVTRAVPGGKLTLARARQVVIEDWARPVKPKK